MAKELKTNISMTEELKKHITFPLVFKVFGSLYGLGLIVYLFNRDDKDQYKGWNEAILIIQLLILLLLWVGDIFPCVDVFGIPLIIWVCGVLLLILAFCVLMRFKNDQNKAPWFIVGNLVLMASLLMSKRKRCEPTAQKVTQPANAKTQVTKKTKPVRNASKPDPLNMNLERLKHHYEKVGVKVTNRTNTPEELKRYYALRRVLLRRGVKPALLDALVM